MIDDLDQLETTSNSPRNVVKSSPQHTSRGGEVASSSSTPFVVVANANVHKGKMHGMASNGGEIPLKIEGVKSKFVVQFLALNDKFLNVQLRIYADNEAPTEQKYVRTKVKREKVIVEKKIKYETDQLPSTERVEYDEVEEL